MTHADTIARARAGLASERVAAVRGTGYWRDPERYNLVVHFLPIELAGDSALGERVVEGVATRPPKTCLYLHLPACTGRCTFCHYEILVNPGPHGMDRYLSALRREIDRRAASFGEITSVLVGGGTPTFQSAAQLHELIDFVRQRARVPPEVEFTVESSPETLDLGKLEALRAAGVNRLNIGVQSFEDRHLRWLGRRHDARAAEEAIGLARRAGFDNINIDLMYALPDQTVPEWLASLDRAASLEVESICTYHLRKRPGTQIAGRPSPPDDTNLIMHLAAEERLTEHGYAQNLIDYWSRGASRSGARGPGPEWGQLQARDKWLDMMPVDGMGISACSRRPDTIAFNHAGLDAWLDAVEADRPAIAKGRALTVDEMRAQRAMFQLRITHPVQGGIDVAGFTREFGVSPREVFAGSLEEMLGLGLLEHGTDGRGGERIRLSFTGRLFADEVCEQFYTDEMRRSIRRRIAVGPVIRAGAIARGSRG